MTHWYRNVGIDLGLKSAHEVVAIAPSGKPVRFKYGHTAEDLDGMLTRLTTDLPAGGKLRFVMEPTDSAWVPVAYYLIELGYEVYLVSASVVYDFRRALSKHAKSDRLDALTLAGLFAGPMSTALNRVQFGTRSQEMLKRLVKRDYRLITGITDRKKRIEAFIRLGLPAGIGEELDIFAPAGRFLCNHYLNPDAVLKMGALTLAVELAPLAGARAEHLARTWYTACEQAVALYGSEGPVPYNILEWELRMELSALGREEEELRQVRELSELVYRDIDAEGVLLTAPGVGPVVAAAVAAAIGDAHRFPTAKQFRAYTGIVPKVSRSGVTDSKGRGITKAGPNWLKRQLFLAASVARRIDPELAKVYYDQMVKYGHHHTHAVCAVATRLADRLFICYREKRPYEIRDLEGNPISAAQGKAYIAEHLTVSEEVRKRLRRGTRAKKGKTTPRSVRAS